MELYFFTLLAIIRFPETNNKTYVESKNEEYCRKQWRTVGGAGGWPAPGGTSRGRQIAFTTLN